MKVFSTIISASLLIGSVTGLLGGVPVSPDGASEDRRLQQKSYTAGIRMDIDPKSSDNFSYCGGVLISRSHVLTTITCTLEGNAKFVSVGAIYINGGEDGDEIKVVSVTKHPHFNNETLSNNFAVLKLKREVKADIKPVKLPIPGTDIQPGKWATALGWGLTSADGMASDVLLKLDQQLISNEDCRTVFNSFTIDMTHVCAGGEAGKSPCQGDIGGPLIHENSKGGCDDILIGLISGGTDIGCGTKGYPAIYSRVSSVLDWITTTMKA
ncbi:hypothetical protein KXD40_004684 [Peronospora effusa]|uniref:Peptidase S1 domain-containing protein n=1 Tax=Peronospora effusa TaxID=542832 RepID=A0A3M6V6K8_9STRA|nr:hypothetical protein DD238_008545 [Peronospora effusa]RQM09054.1 hypothetical protein DD237_008498 [Peronospora effusa]UIZ28191.1 hypothetical protein KXD40_004684 [Peronospora effusa]CAI5721446.1 unnamed protein product [Peronospora effusa]